MTEYCARRLSSFCRERVGGGFLGSLLYTETEFRKIHSSPEARAAFSDDEVDRLVGRARLVHRALLEASHIGSSLGEPESVVTQFERLFTIQIPMSDHDGVVLLFTRDVGRNLSTFVAECRSFVGSDGTDTATA